VRVKRQFQWQWASERQIPLTKDILLGTVVEVILEPAELRKYEVPSAILLKYDNGKEIFLQAAGYETEGIDIQASIPVTAG